MPLIKKKPGRSPATQPGVHGSVFGCLYVGAERAVYNGLRRANDDFLKAVIRYSRFREIHIFCEKAALGIVKGSWSDFIRRYGSDKKILFLPAHELYRYFSSTRYQVFHQGDPYIGHLASLRDAYSNEPFPLTGRAHTLSTDSHLSRSRDLLLSPLKSCDAILCSSRAQKRVMKRLLAAASASISDHIGVAIPYKGEVELLPLAVESDDAYQGTRSEAREQLGYPIDGPVILTLGRVTPADKMDLHPLLLVLNDLVENHGHSDALLVIAGAGDASHESVQSLLKQAYALNIENSIRFELSIDDERKRWLYAACDIFISLAENIQESFGLAPLEAMLHGAPVVLSDWNGYSELVQDGHSGFLIHTLSADHDELSRPAGALVGSQAHLIQAQGTVVNLSQCVDVVHQLLTDDRLLRHVAEQGRERVLQSFCWEQVVDSYHELGNRLNKEAEQLSCANGRPVGIPYHQVFAHYPSEQVSEEMTFMTTDRGIRRLLNSEPGFFYSELEGLLKPEQINQLAAACLSGRSLRELKSQYSHGGTGSGSLVFTLLWMCKYQLLEVGKPQRAHVISPVRAVLPDRDRLTRELISQIRCNEPHRFKLIEPLLVWIDRQCVPVHGQTENLRLRGDLVNHLASHMDEQLLQAIGWVSNELGISGYADVLDHIVSKGGVEYLAGAYPQWYRLNRRIIVRALRDTRRLFRRFYQDRGAINVLFEAIWSQPAADIVRVTFPYGHSPGSVTCLELDNGERLIYKNRDVRIDCHIIGFSESRNNIAGSINRWLSGKPGVQTHRILPGVDQGNYGFCEYIAPQGNDDLSEEQAAGYYQQLGVLSGLAILLGLGDLHHRNLVSNHGHPYLVDAEVAFSPLVIRAFEAELANPLVAFARGMEDCSLQKTEVRHVLESFHYCWLKACSYTLDGGEVLPSSPEQCCFHQDNLIRVGGRSGQDAVQSPLAALYDSSMEQGIRTVIEVVSEHVEEWSELLHQCNGMQVGHLPLLDLEKIQWQRCTLMTYHGFQTFSQKRLRGYFNRMARRICLGGEEVQHWVEPEWKESCGMLADAVSSALLVGKEPHFVRELGGSSVLMRAANGCSVNVTGENYFSCDPVDRVLNLITKMSEDTACREQFITVLTAIFKQWLNEQFQPGLSLPEALRGEQPE